MRHGPIIRAWTLSLLAMWVGCGGGTPVIPTGQNARSATRRENAARAPARVIGLGTLDDALAPGDPRDEDGRHQRSYEIDLDPEERVRILVTASEIDPMVRVLGPDGFQLENDDVSPSSLDAMLEFYPPAAGRYQLIVTSAPPGQTGHYQLRVEPREGTNIGARIVLGQRTSGMLGQTIDPDLGPFVAPLQFEADGGSIVRVRVTSRDFDTIATILGPNGQTWFNDDANDLGTDGTERPLDSTLVIAVPVTGTYRLLVSAYGRRGTGAFQVATTLRPPVIVRPGELAPPGPFAGPEGRGRILGLYAGITEYRTEGRLYGCADDARLLADAMRAAHLQTPIEQTVLVDAMATRSAFLAGLQDLAQRAVPDDVVMVFWSGHGNVQPAVQDPGELDGLDETIQMIDGPLTDTEVAAALDQVRAQTIVLAIDACYSGGFADDFVRQPGRIGLFSSDEDVLSSTAEPRRAGGYLSWYLRTGVLGHADSKPRDGVLYAGELTDFLSEGFVRDHPLMNGHSGLDPLQRLVVRRGSVGWSDVLWVYPRGEDLAMPALPALDLASAPTAAWRAPDSPDSTSVSPASSAR